MKSKKIILVVVILFIALQLVPVERTNPLVESEIPTNTEVKNILKNSCYDCHSNETIWPWYSYVAPASFFITSHVEEGRKHLNFSEWGSLDSTKIKKKLHEIIEVVEEGEMPLKSYLILHSNAGLKNGDFETIKKWVADLEK